MLPRRSGSAPCVNGMPSKASSPSCSKTASRWRNQCARGQNSGQSLRILVVVAPLFAVRLRRDDRRRAARLERLQQPVRVERLVRQEGAEQDILDERGCAPQVVRLARQQHEVGQVAQAIDQGDDLGRQTAARAPDGLMPSPPFAPEAFWWAWTMVPSTRADSKSGVPRISLKMRSNTPALAHLRKRRNALFQAPDPSGRSRQGSPVRTRHKTASTNIRLSRHVAPLSPSLPGKSGAIHAQTSSDTTNRGSSITASQFRKVTQPTTGKGILNAHGL